jgi:hypothetical protein
VLANGGYDRLKQLGEVSEAEVACFTVEPVAYVVGGWSPFARQSVASMTAGRYGICS